MKGDLGEVFFIDSLNELITSVEEHVKLDQKHRAIAICQSIRRMAAKYANRVDELLGVGDDGVVPLEESAIVTILTHAQSNLVIGDVDRAASHIESVKRVMKTLARRKARVRQLRVEAKGVLRDRDETKRY